MVILIQYYIHFFVEKLATLPFDLALPIKLSGSLFTWRNEVRQLLCDCGREAVERSDRKWRRLSAWNMNEWMLAYSGKKERKKKRKKDVDLGASREVLRRLLFVLLSMAEQTRSLLRVFFGKRVDILFILFFIDAFFFLEKISRFENETWRI